MHHRVPRSAAFVVVLGALAFTSACSDAALDSDTETGEGTTADSALTITGSASATTGRWQTFPFTAKVGDVIDAKLDWDNAAANLNLYLYDPAGTVVAFDNGAAKPARAQTTAKLGGGWRLAVLCGTASAKFTIDLSITPAAPTAPVARFPGDPGPGKLYMGAAVRSQSADAFDSLESQLAGKKFTMSRLYYADTISWSNVDAHIARGRIPAVSFKPGNKTVANIVSGAEDAWIDGIGAAIKSRAPVPFYMTFFHEPEDNFPTAAEAATFRAASRRIVTRWRTAGVKNFTYVTDYYMTGWTFTGSGRDWRWWYPDWKGTTAAGSSKDSPNIADFYTGTSAVVDILGLDIYNWWEIGQASTKWTSFQTHADTALSRTKFLGKPYCVGEYGTMAYQANGTYDAARTKAWVVEAYNYMLQNNFVCGMYWSNDNVDGGWDPRLDLNDPQKLRLSALSDVMGRAGTATPRW